MQETTVRREDLLQALESVSPGLANKEIIEQSTCYVLKDGLVYTFNDEISCRAPSYLPKEIGGAVQSGPLLALLQKLPDVDVRISPGDGELVVRGERREAGVRTESDIHLDPVKFEQPGKWHKLPEDFSEALRIAVQCVGKDESLHAKVCVHLTPEWLESCDGNQMVRYKTPTGLPKDVIARGDSLKHVIAVDMTEVSLSENWVHFKNPAGLVFSCKQQVGNYPDLGPHLKKLEGGRPAALPKILAEAALRAEDFSRENVDGNKVKVELKPGRVKVKGHGIRGRYMEYSDARYDGEPLAFLMTPELLVEVSKKQDRCTITDSRIRVYGGKWTYVACLGKVEEEKPVPEANGNGKAKKVKKAKAGVK